MHPGQRLIKPVGEDGGEELGRVKIELSSQIPLSFFIKLCGHPFLLKLKILAKPVIGVEDLWVCGLPKCLDFVLGRVDKVLAHLNADNIQVRVKYPEQGFIKLTHLEPGILGLGSFHLEEPKLCLGKDKEVYLSIVPTCGILEMYPAIVDEGLWGDQPA
jgi:hypothetical protein